jgi:hypothetical protein
MYQRLTAFLTLAATMSFVTPALADESPRTPRSVAVEQRSSDETSEQRASRPLASPSDEARYRAREASTPRAEAYRGGDAIVIGATTATVVLAVILLAVLI